LTDVATIAEAAVPMVTAASSFWWVQPTITALVGIFGGGYAWATINANR
jgi:hypothetical protein